MTELVTNRARFILEEFTIGETTMNYTFIGHENNPTAYEAYEFSLVYVERNELEAVKNFLLTIRDDIPS